MRKLVLIPIIFISLFTQAQKDQLILASDIWPPFTNEEGEKAIALDIVKHALNNSEVEVEFEILPFDDVMSGIRTEKYDGSAALWKNEGREKTLLFSDAYLNNQLILVGRADSDVSARSLSALNGKRIGIVENYSYGEEVASSQSITFVQGNSDQQNLERLLAKKVDYILVDALLIQYLLNYQVNDVSAFLEIASAPLIVRSLHFAVDKRHMNAEEIILNFNKEIQTMIADGSYNDILELNWIRADVDGDGKMELVLKGNKAGLNPPAAAYGVQTTNEDNYSEGFYINGKYYATWDQVPADLKVAMPKPDYSGYHEGGVILKF